MPVPHLILFCFVSFLKISPFIRANIHIFVISTYLIYIFLPSLLLMQFSSRLIQSYRKNVLEFTEIYILSAITYSKYNGHVNSQIIFAIKNENKEEEMFVEQSECERRKQFAIVLLCEICEINL